MTNIKHALDRIETDLGDLKRQYDLFFQGVRRTEPQEERRILEWMVKRLGQRKLPNTKDQFRFGALQSRFFSYFNLWTRMVRDMEEAGNPNVVKAVVDRSFNALYFSRSVIPHIRDTGNMDLEHQTTF